MSFFDNLANFGEQPCLIDSDGEVFSYQDISQLCEPIANFLSSDKKKLVLIECENRHEAIVGYLSVLQASSAALLVNASLSAELKAEIIKCYQPHYVWRLIGDSAHAPVKHVGAYGLFPLNEDADTALHPSLSLLLSTSGSTGSPKFVRLTQGNVTSNAESIAEYLELDINDKPITTLPMAYSYGLSVINSHLHVGAAILLTEDSLMTKTFWAFLKGQQATSMAGVPYVYEMLKRLRFGRMALPSLKKMTQAGGKLSVELVKEMAELTQDKGIRFYVMYGQTEATARISYVPYESVAEKFYSVGKAIPGGSLYLIDESKQRINGCDIEGELVYQGPNVMMGYAENDQDLLKSDELGGVLHTGDIAKIDEDGFICITGRLKRIIKMFGNRVNLDDIDRFIHSQGCQSVCGGVDDLLKIAIVGNDDIDVIKKAVITQFKFDHRSVEVFQLAEIPRNDSGKILYSQIFKDPT